MIKRFKKQTAGQLWKIYGDFGYVNGSVLIEDNKTSVVDDRYCVCSEYEENECGVISRKSNFQNLSSQTMSLSCLQSKFVLDGGEYEVYTQANSWQNESRGLWQPLNSSIVGETCGLRNAYGTAPFFCVWNAQTRRGIAFHILTRQPWKYTIRHTPTGAEICNLEIEVGLNDCNLALQIEAGEKIELPEILYYEFRNKTDMDCHKLHQFINEKYPRRELPIVYNTWLYQFDRITFNNVVTQIERAKELGVEYFVIDAGWFGYGETAWFWGTRGDWYENQEGGFAGRMAELSELVRSNGMKFGIWLEIETAGNNSKMLKAHEEYYFTYGCKGDELYFFDFAKAEAREYLLNTIGDLIKTYHVQCFKFDFNQDLEVDVSQTAFKNYFEGYQEFVKQLRQAYPNLYMENCASGGLRMSLTNGLDFDSFWLSDNQSPYEGVRIFKDTIKRVAPQMIEKWATVQSVCDFKHYYQDNSCEKIIATNDGTWSDVRGVHPSYLNAFLTGGVIGFSCDLNSLSETAFNGLKEFVLQYKKDRNFWKKAVCRILVDSESVLALEFSNANFEQIEIVIYTNRIRQETLTLYPVSNPLANYCINGNRVMNGEEMEAEGIQVRLEGNYQAKIISMHSNFL